MWAHLKTTAPLEKRGDLAAPSVGINETNMECVRTLPVPSVMRPCPGSAPQKANAASHRQNPRLQEQLKNETLKTQEQIASECAAVDSHIAQESDDGGALPLRT
jgi:hypothetical protein